MFTMEKSNLDTPLNFEKFLMDRIEIGYSLQRNKNLSKKFPFILKGH